MFKGTKRRPQMVDISRELDRFGAQYNAYTGKDMTGYWVKIDGTRTAIAIDLLHDMLFHSKFDEKEMTREKKVILEEIKMYEENPIMHIEDMIEEALFYGHVLGKNIAGTSVSVLAINRAELLSYRDRLYHPENMVVVLSGKVPADARARLRATFGRVRKAPHPFHRDIDAFPFVERSGLISRTRVQKKLLDQVQLAFAYPTRGRGSKEEKL